MIFEAIPKLLHVKTVPFAPLSENNFLFSLLKRSLVEAILNTRGNFKSHSKNGKDAIRKEL